MMKTERKETKMTINKELPGRSAANEKSKALERCMMSGSIRALDGENKRQFEISFSSEEPYTRRWGTEILSHSEGAVNLERLNSIGVMLYNHNRDTVLGKILNAEVKDGRGKAIVEFDTDDESELIYQKVASGTLKGVSVGYIVEDWEDVAANKKSSDGRFTGPCSIATRWEPYEVSIVSVPADPTVGVGRSQEKEKVAPAQQDNTGVGGFYFNEKQLQINKNLLCK